MSLGVFHGGNLLKVNLYNSVKESEPISLRKDDWACVESNDFETIDCLWMPMKGIPLTSYQWISGP